MLSSIHFSKCNSKSIDFTFLSGVSLINIVLKMFLMMYEMKAFVSNCLFMSLGIYCYSIVSAYFFCFTLYPAYSRIDRVKLVLRFDALRVEWRNWTPHFILLLQRLNENNSFHKMGIEPTTVEFTVRSSPAAPRLIIIKNKIVESC